VQDAFHGPDDLRLSVLRGLLEELFQQRRGRSSRPQVAHPEQRRVAGGASSRRSLRRWRILAIAGAHARALRRRARRARRRGASTRARSAARRGAQARTAVSASRMPRACSSSCGVPKSCRRIERRTSSRCLAQIEDAGVFPRLIEVLRRQPVAEIQPTLARVLSLAGQDRIRAALSRRGLDRPRGGCRRDAQSARPQALWGADPAPGRVGARPTPGDREHGAARSAGRAAASSSRSPMAKIPRILGGRRSWRWGASVAPTSSKRSSSPRRERATRTSSLPCGADAAS
jgi:hypothetical protein